MSLVTDVIIRYSDRGGQTSRRLKRFFDEFCTNDSFHELEISGWGGSFKKFFPEFFLPYLASCSVEPIHQLLYDSESGIYIDLDMEDIIHYFCQDIYDRRKQLLTMSSEEFWQLIEENSCGI